MKKFIRDISAFTAEEKTAYVKAGEDAFASRVSEVAGAVASRRDIRILGLTGPTCSGKTTAAHLLVKKLEALGRKAHTVSLDDYYLDRVDIDAKCEAMGIPPDYESALALDLSKLKADIESLFTKGYADIPRYDFASGARARLVRLCVGENEVVLFEGIQAVCPEVSSLFHVYPSLTVFICPGTSLSDGEETFEPNEIRLMRRLVRDFRYRDANAFETFSLWKAVRANEERNIFPYRESADEWIDSTMPYEMNLLKPYLDEVLDDLPDGGIHSEIEQELLRRTAGITPLSPDFLPADSLYREFI